MPELLSHSIHLVVKKPISTEGYLRSTLQAGRTGFLTIGCLSGQMPQTPLLELLNITKLRLPLYCTCQRQLSDVFLYLYIVAVHSRPEAYLTQG